MKRNVALCMKILALEFSPPQRSVAVLQTDPSGVAPAACEIVEGGSEGIRALDMVEEALRQAQLEREQIGCLVVGLGPGSYNGIRAAIALAQGWQLANDVQLLGVSSAECIAAQAQAEGVTGRVNVLIDAQRNEFYLAAYEIAKNADFKSIETGGAGFVVPPLGGTPGEPPEGGTTNPGIPARFGKGWREVEPLRLATMAEARERERAGEVLIGSEVTRWFPAGRIVFPRASTLGRMAPGRNDCIAAEKLEPIYLRQTTFAKAPPPRPIGR
jgi:tRNA threonylcarbamoyl adenosine modification protein YeaZ